MQSLHREAAFIIEKVVSMSVALIHARMAENKRPVREPFRYQTKGGLTERRGREFL